MITLFQKNYKATTKNSKIYTIQQTTKGEVHELIRYFKPQKNNPKGLFFISNENFWVFNKFCSKGDKRARNPHRREK